MNTIPDEVLEALRKRVVKTTGSEDHAQDACIDLLFADLDAKPLNYIVGDLVKKYRSKAFRQKRNRKEIPVSELVSDGSSESNDDFLDGLVKHDSRLAIDIKDHVPDSLRPAIGWLELGCSLEETARLCGISYDSLRWRFHYHIKKLLRASHQTQL